MSIKQELIALAEQISGESNLSAADIASAIRLVAGKMPEEASATKAGLVKQGVAVADAAGSAPTAAEFKALLDSLRDSGAIATAST